MSLSKFGGIHPYVKERVRYLLAIADRNGGRYTVTSGRRTQAAQANLWVKQSRLPAAFPGCSSHEYGLAIDVKFQEPRWQEFYQWAARRIGLHTVPGDNVHVQGLAPSVINPFLKQMGVCPASAYRNLTRGAVGINEMMCGKGGGIFVFKTTGGTACLPT